MKVQLIKELDKLSEVWYYWSDAETKQQLTPHRIDIDKAQSDFIQISKLPIYEILETKDI